MASERLSWRLNGILASDANDSLATHAPGKSLSFSFAFRPRAGEPENAFRDRFEQARSLTNFAGQYDTYEGITGTTFYRENGPGSVLVGIEATGPESDGVEGGGVWGLVDSSDDSSDAPRTVLKLDIDVAYLADYRRYSDRAAVEAELEAPGP